MEREIALSTENEPSSRSLSRRRLLKTGATAVSGLALGGAALSGGVTARPNGAQVTEIELPERTIPLDNPCTGERLRITDGSLHSVVHTVEDDTDGIHVNLQANIKDGRAVGVDSDTVYMLTGAASANSTIKKGTVGTLTANFNAISRGAADNLRLKSVLHVTVNAAGDVTASLASLTVECRG